jgi:insulysin
VDYLNEYAYYAQAARLHYGLSLSDNGFELSLTGFNHKLRILLEAVIQKMANFQVKPDRFSVVKETVIKAFQNYKFQTAHSNSTA